MLRTLRVRTTVQPGGRVAIALVEGTKLESAAWISRSHC